MTATGLWREPGVPHKDWTCVDIEDLGEPDHICEMCKVQEVRMFTQWSILNIKRCASAASALARWSKTALALAGVKTRSKPPRNVAQNGSPSRGGYPSEAMNTVTTTGSISSFMKRTPAGAGK